MARLSLYCGGAWNEVVDFDNLLTADDKKTLNDAISKKLDSNAHIAAFAKELQNLQGIPYWATGTAAGLTTYLLTSLTVVSNSSAVTANSVTSASGRYYKVEKDKGGNLVVNVPWSASSFTGSMGTNTLDLSSSSNGIKFGSGWYVTNMECGTVSATVGKTTNSETAVSVSFHNGSKGSGTWHVFLMTQDSTNGSGWGSSVLAAVQTSPTASGFKISCRRVYGADVSYNSTAFTVHWFAIKYY